MFIKIISINCKARLFKSIMGGWFSSEDKANKVDSSGNVNNINLGGPVDVYSQELVILLSILCLIKIFEMIAFIIANYRRNLKKKIQNQRITAA